MADIYKSITDIPGVKAQPRGFYFNRENQDEIERLLSGFAYGDNTYDDDRLKGAELISKFGLTPDQVEDTLDSFITKFTHHPWGEKNKYMRRKAGRFETGVPEKTSQELAQSLLDKNPNAHGVVYGLHYKGEDPSGNIGLKKPFIVYDDNDYKNLNDSLIWGNETPDFRFHTLYRNTGGK